MARIVCCGEGMLELANRDDNWIAAFGGDTLNTAVHLSRLGHDVNYLSALGTDPVSQDLRSSWQKEGIDCSLVLTHPDRQAGIYAISVDAAGERTFAYWRNDSAAKDMFALPAMAEAAALSAKADLFYFSLITLAILPEAGRNALLSLCQSVRSSGGQVAFDGNYRPTLWRSDQEAAYWRDRAIALANIGLPTFDDEQLLGSSQPAETREYWQELGCGEVVVKLGANGCILPDGRPLPPPRIVQPIDTSGAGDSFNAAYLSARLANLDPAAAAGAGHVAAGRTILYAGAIPPAEILA